MQTNSAKIYNPNAHLADEVIELGQQVVSSTFSRCKMTAREICGDDCGRTSILSGEIGSQTFLVFVRITENNEVEEGTGPMPGILLEAAEEMGAEPHVIRVHVRHGDDGSEGFDYFGNDEFEDHVRSHPAWGGHLIAPKKVEDYRRLLKGRISRLELDSGVSSFAGREWNSLRLRVDGAEPYAGTIGPFDLLSSVKRSGECFIFTCDCGVPECGGVWRGITVVHEGPFTLWKAYYAKGRRIFVFDRDQYRDEVRRMGRELLDFARGRENRVIVPYDRVELSILIGCFEKLLGKDRDCPR